MKLLYFASFLALITLSCNKQPETKPIEYNEIVVGKTDYNNSKHINYEPDIVLHAVVNFNDTINNNQNNIEDYFF